MQAVSRTSRKAQRASSSSAMGDALKSAQISVGKSSRRVSITPKRSSQQLSGANAAVSLYTQPPREEMSLDEFESYAVDRLVVLRTLENLRARGVKGQRDLRQHLGPVLRARLPTNTLAGRKKDEVSHFILRLAYSRTEELRRWFLAQECALFKYRLEELAPGELGSTVRGQDDSVLGFLEEIDTETRTAAAQELRALVCSSKQGIDALAAAGGDIMRMVIYKVPFYLANEAVGRREVLLKNGSALVPEHRLHTILLAKFRTALSRSMTIATRTFAQAVTDPRLAPLLNDVDSVDVLGDEARKAMALEDDNNLEEIHIGQLDQLAETSMPLCMRLTHQALRRDHKLKHWGRVQYGLFLKAAGLSIDDQIAFFQAEFTKLISPDEFTKSYAYGIRHRYGQEGARTDYSAYGCYKIIMDLPGPAPGEIGGQHGCPYKHMTTDALSALLAKTSIDAPNQKAIIQQSKTNNYQVACQLHFQATHPDTDATAHDVSLAGVGNHPNAYFKASRKYYNALHADSKPKQLAPVFQKAAPPTTVHNKKRPLDIRTPLQLNSGPNDSAPSVLSPPPAAAQPPVADSTAGPSTAFAAGFSTSSF